MASNLFDPNACRYRIQGLIQLFLFLLDLNKDPNRV